MNSPTEENYLKALLALSGEGSDVNVKELSEQLGIKMPTVTSMMKKLAEKGLVQYESYKPLRLTEKGRQAAGLIVRKHRLTEMFLVEKMGFGWEAVHDIAEQIEHLHSPLFFQKMDEMLGFPKIDPHGSPIPDEQGNMEWKSYRKLSDCQPGEVVTLSAVIHTSSDFLKYLNSRELRLGVQVSIQSVEAFDRSMVVSYDARKAETLSHVVCERLLVE
jgi:DtxR family Mn-dependent transcriptional regulator